MTEETHLVAILKVLADENRLKILACLSGGEMCVCQLTEAIDIAQNLMSHHLKVLKDAGLIKDERRGRWVYYSSSTTDFGDLLARIGSLCNCSNAEKEDRCL